MTRAWNRTPGLSSDAGEFRFGLEFSGDVPVLVTGVWWYWLTDGPSVVTVSLWTDDTTSVASGSKSSGWSAGWHLINFSTPYTLPAATQVTAVAHIDDGFHGYDNSGLPRDSDDGNLNLVQGRFQSGSGDRPDSTWTGLHGVDVEYSTSIDGTLAAALPALSAALTGDQQTDGVLAATLPALTAALTGDQQTDGVLAATLPALIAALTATTSATGAPTGPVSRPRANAAVPRPYAHP